MSCVLIPCHLFRGCFEHSNSVALDLKVLFVIYSSSMPQEPMDSRRVVCSKLPLDVIEHVLSFLSVPDLCRQSRVVCKAWDELVGKARLRDLSDSLDKERLVCRSSIKCSPTKD